MYCCLFISLSAVFSEIANHAGQEVRIAILNSRFRLTPNVPLAGVAVPKSKRKADARQFYLACDLKVFRLTLFGIKC